MKATEEEEEEETALAPAPSLPDVGFLRRRGPPGFANFPIFFGNSIFAFEYVG